VHSDQLVCSRCSTTVAHGTCATCRAGRAEREVRRRLLLIGAALVGAVAALASLDLAVDFAGT
jgi:hypothetical protein